MEVDLKLRGVGTVEGLAQGPTGPVSGSVLVKGTGPGCVGWEWRLAVGPSGEFRIPEIVAGPVTASFSTQSATGPWLYASDADVVQPSATTTLRLLVEPSGSVRGTVVHDDGTPALGSKVRVESRGSPSARSRFG
jgi:hypothetical protein